MTEASIMGQYLRRLRSLVPARTMATYTAITGMYPMLETNATSLPVYLPFIVVGICLVIQVLLGIFNDGKKWYVIMLSGIAFFLYVLTQPYMGILAVLGAGPIIHFIFTLVIVAYVILIPAFVKDLNPQAQA